MLPVITQSVNIIAMLCLTQTKATYLLDNSGKVKRNSMDAYLHENIIATIHIQCKPIPLILCLLEKYMEITKYQSIFSFNSKPKATYGCKRCLKIKKKKDCLNELLLDSQFYNFSIFMLCFVKFVFIGEILRYNKLIINRRKQK